MGQSEILHVKARMNDEIWIISKEAYDKLKFTDKQGGTDWGNQW